MTKAKNPSVLTKDDKKSIVGAKKARKKLVKQYDKKMGTDKKQRIKP